MLQTVDGTGDGIPRDDGFSITRIKSSLCTCECFIMDGLGSALRNQNNCYNQTIYVLTFTLPVHDVSLQMSKMINLEFKEVIDVQI